LTVIMPESEKSLEESEVIVRIRNALLAYIMYGLNSGTREKTHNVVLGHFSPESINTAKHILWEECREFLGDPLNRRGSNQTETTSRSR